MKVNTTIRGLERLIKKASPEILAGPLRKFFERSTITVQGAAREKAPKDNGQLANSIATEIDPGNPHPLWGKVGTNLTPRASALEFGTGLLAEGEGAKGGVHFPPWGDRNPELELWARRHGFPNGFVVARAIARRGGLHPLRYLRNALAESRGQIQSFLTQAERDVRALWDRH